MSLSELTHTQRLAQASYVSYSKLAQLPGNSDFAAVTPERRTSFAKIMERILQPEAM
jgi:hypothetical protein